MSLSADSTNATLLSRLEPKARAKLYSRIANEGFGVVFDEFKVAGDERMMLIMAEIAEEWREPDPEESSDAP